jgi:peptide/nickel transport system substrate-binding protein
MTDLREHAYLPKLKQQFAEGRCDRREFLRSATLLGLSASAAYAFVGKVTGETWVPQAKAAMPKGGTLRIGMRVLELTNPHAYAWFEVDITRQICEHLTRTGQDNITRPHMLEGWSASDDLRTWTLNLRKDIKWHNGRDFVADDVIWNLQHVLDPKAGSSMVGLMKGYMLNDIKVAGEDSVELWDANAIEKVDDHTVRLNCKAPQLAVPEHLFHYPMHIIDPEEGGVFKPGSNGTGAFDLVDYQVGEQATIKARNDYWGEGPHLDMVRFIDLGDEASAGLAALASGQVDGLYEASFGVLDALKQMPNIAIYEVATAQTGVARVKANQKPFDDPRIRKALRLATDSKRTLELAHRGLGLAGEHHHVCPIHPEYAELPFMGQDIAAAKALLAEAGHPDGIDLEIACKPDPAWELAAVQSMVEQWKEAGIRVKINVMPAAQYWEVWTEAPFGFTEWTHRPLGVMVLALAYRSGVPWNESSYANPEFDELLTKAEGVIDVEERRKVIAQIETIMQEDGPVVQPIWRSVFTAYDKKVKGFKMHPTLYIFAEDLAIES